MNSIKIYYKTCGDRDLIRFFAEGGVVVDVRTPPEFLAGHVEGAINIPLENVLTSLHRLRNRHQPIITCSTSGMKSASATVLLESLGYTHVCNGGSYKSLNQKLQHGFASV